jgi:hypothetical protein
MLIFTDVARSLTEQHAITPPHVEDNYPATPVYYRDTQRAIGRQQVDQHADKNNQSH